MTVVNSTAGPVTFTTADGDTYYVAACGTAEFSWSGGWKAVAGVSESVPGAVKVEIHVTPPPDAPGVFFEVVTAERVLDYAGTPPPSVPGCGRPAGQGRLI